MDIVEEIRSDPERGAKRLESEYRAGLLTLAMRICHDPGDAAELVNRTFAEVIENIDGYAEQSAFFGWMSKILVNLHSKDVRRKSHDMESMPGDVAEMPDEESLANLYRNLDHALLRDAVRSLPAEDRELVVMHYFLDIPIPKMAKVLAIPAGTVKSRLFYARKALAAKLGSAVKKPGGKALLLALALACTAALGAAVWSFAVAGEAQNRDAEAVAWIGGTGETGETDEETGGTGASPKNSSVPDLLFSQRRGAVATFNFLTEPQQETTTMDNTLLRTLTAPLAALALTANAYETAISDTSGYIVQNASDGFNQNSLVAGAHFPGGAPVAGKHYLVNNGLNTRTPPTDNASNTFKGDSLTLDGGANLMLKGKGSTFTVNNLIVYNALVTQSQGGNTTVTLGGNMTAKGTASAPLIIQGNADGGARRINLTSAISGDATARIKVQHVEGDSPDREGHQFYTHFMGNNSAYAGSIEVEGGGNGVCLVGYGNTSFGSSPAITLSQNGKLFGGGNGGSTTLSGAAITLDGGGTLGVYKNGSSSQGLILSGGTISGSGMLTINNSGAEGAHDRRVVLGNVAISGIDGIVVQGGVLQFAPGYSNPATPITMAQSKMLRTAEGISAGPVTLQAESFMNLSGENVTLASLTFDQTDDTPPYIIKLLRAGCITVTGDITNRLVSGQKMRIDFNDNLDSIRNQFKTVKSFRILSAANLGEPGVTADDFVATSSAYDATGYVAAFITNGTFSIETDGATKYLVYTLDRNAVVSTGTDAAGQCSFMADTHWSDSATPHGTADYFILGGHEIRTKERTTSKFGGHSLSVLSGGSLALVGNASGIKSTVGDLRLYGGAILTAKRNWGNYLDGNITVNGTAATPVVFQTEWASNGEGDTTTARTLHVSAAVSGGGSIRCQYQGPVFNPERPAVLKLLGDNNGFTGQWQIMHPAAQATFTSAASVGAASAIAFNSNGVFHAEGASFAIPAATEVIVNNIGGVSGSEDLTNGGTFEVDDALTLTVSGVVSGSGILRKTGAGTLLLDAENTLAGPLVVSQGLVGGAGKVGAVELADGAGFRVSATQAAPFEIGTLTIDGDIALDIANFAAANADRIAVAKVGTLSGMLPGSPVSMTIDGRKSKSLWLSLSGGVIYAERSPFVIIVR